MEPWHAVSWTETGQVLDFMDADEADRETAPPDIFAHYNALRADGRLAEAALFVGHALPRFESLAWAARVLDELSRQDRLRPRDRQALDSALRFLGEPCEEFRLSARAMSATATPGSAEQFIAMAVEYSGGSISLPELEPVAPPPFACNRAASGAVLGACYRGPAPDERLARALELGEAVARDGMGALTAA